MVSCEKACKAGIFESGRDPTTMPALAHPLTCADLLGAIMPMNTDPAIGSIWERAYYLCVAKISLEACLIHVIPEEAESIKKRLKEINILCNACLMALTASYIVFRDPEVRHQMNEELAQGKLVDPTSD